MNAAEDVGETPFHTAIAQPGLGLPVESGAEARDPRYFTVSFFEPAGLPSSITSTS